MIKYLLILLTLFSCDGYAYKYDLTVCAIFCDDDLPYMAEWIDFHEKQGVDHFYLYSHNSNQILLKSYLQSYIDKNLIEIEPWNFSYNIVEEWNHIQQNAYMHCMNKIKDKTYWCAIIDTDEFLFSPKYGNLKKALKKYEDYSGVCVNWIFFGTSNHILLPEQKLTDHLLYREKLIPEKLAGVKSIVKPRYVTQGWIHRFDYSKSYCVNENYQRIDGFDSPLSCEIFRINHYWTRDLLFFLNFKIPRRLKWNQDVGITIEWEKNMNIERDDIIRKFN